MCSAVQTLQHGLAVRNSTVAVWRLGQTWSAVAVAGSQPCTQPDSLCAWSSGCDRSCWWWWSKINWQVLNTCPCVCKPGTEAGTGRNMRSSGACHCRDQGKPGQTICGIGWQVSSILKAWFDPNSNHNQLSNNLIPTKFSSFWIPTKQINLNSPFNKWQTRCLTNSHLFPLLDSPLRNLHLWVNKLVLSAHLLPTPIYLYLQLNPSLLSHHSFWIP